MQKNYYAVIPANVRYCPNIPDGAKLLYGEITALCNEAGYCWASNKYFADLYNKSNDTIGRWIGDLAKSGFIYSLVDKENGNSRKIWLSESQHPTGKNADTLPAKMPQGSRQKYGYPTGKNAASYNRYNNTVNNTSKNAVAGASEKENAFDKKANGQANASTSVDSGALPNPWYTFEMFWNDYAHKVGSKSKCEKAFAKLSGADRQAICDTIEMYKRDTVTSDAGRGAGPFKPLRQNPQTYLNGRGWDIYVEKMRDARQDEQPSEFDEAYQKYFKWVDTNFPAARRNCTYFSKGHFVEYKKKNFANIISTKSDLRFLTSAHEAAANDGKDAWTVYQSLVEQRLKARQV